MPTTFLVHGPYVHDPWLKTLDTEALTHEEKRSERAWRLYNALHLYEPQDLRKVIIGVVSEECWAALIGRGQDIPVEYFAAIETAPVGYRLACISGYTFSIEEIAAGITGKQKRPS